MFSPADLFLVGQAIIVRWNVSGVARAPLLPPTHRVEIPVSAWHRDDLGVTVVPVASLVALNEIERERLLLAFMEAA
jgi:hypothetical protein